MDLVAQPALLFLPLVLPVCIYVAWSDLARMTIPNVAVAALLLIYAVGGLIALPVEVYLWRWSHFAVVLVLGFFANMARLFGAGDAKFMAAAAPFVMWQDLSHMLSLLCICLLAGVATHRLARRAGLPRLTPDWKSWTSGKRFPMGYPLAATLVIYLGLSAISR